MTVSQRQTRLTPSSLFLSLCPRPNFPQARVIMWLVFVVSVEQYPPSTNKSGDQRSVVLLIQPRPRVMPGAQARSRASCGFYAGPG